MIAQNSWAQTTKPAQLLIHASFGTARHSVMYHIIFGLTKRRDILIGNEDVTFSTIYKNTIL